ncbi:MAG: diguanylate cyclase [Pseudomonadota bacterium]
MPGKKLHFVVGLCVLLALGFLTTSLVSFFVARNSLQEQIAESTLPLTSDNIYSEIQRDLLRPIFISSLMAHDTFMRDWTLAGEENSDQITRYLSEIQSRYETITAFFVSEATRRYYHTSGVLKQVSEDDPADSWYFRARDIKEPFEINVDEDTADRSRLTIFVNYQVRDYQNRVIGVAGVGLSVNSVTALIETYQQRYGRDIYFVDRQGNITLHGSGFGSEKTLHDRPGLRPLAMQILTSPGTSLTYQDGGETIFVNSRLVSEFDWLLLVEQHQHIGDQKIENTLLFNIVISLGITILVGLIAYFTVRNYQKRLEDMASLDKLTGACNRQVFDIVFDNVVKACQRRKEGVAMVCLDIDEFRDVNDTYGHPGGDIALRETANIIRNLMRPVDTLCRWGGDEFILLMPATSLAEATAKTREIADAIRENAVRYGRDNIRITISAGVSEHREGESLSTLVSRVDNALYSAKKSGHDHIEQA